ncbi:flippase [Patescibacteria group bacterium]|nr:MAG: flippase [Patescibacteria group bacterium]
MRYILPTVSGSDVAKNTLYLTIASVGQKLLSFVYFLLIARVMKPEATGGYFLALSVITVALVVSDFGTNSVIIREVAKKPDDVGLVRRALALKLLTTILGSAFAFLAATTLGYAPDVRTLVLLAVAVMAADTFSQFYYGVLRGLRRLGYESVGLFVGMGSTLAVGSLSLAFSPTLPMLILALFVGSAFNLAFAATMAARRLGSMVLVPTFDLSGSRPLLRAAFPFLLAGLFVKVYSYVDVQFLNHYLGPSAVGVYSIAYKYTYAFQFLPLAFVAALYPGMSARVGKDPAGLARLFERAVWYMLLLAMPLAFGLWAIAGSAVALVGPEYAAAAPVLGLFAFVLIPAFLDFPVGSLLNAAGRQGTKTAIFGIVMAVNALLNWLLIPRFGMMGAAAASVTSTWVLVVCGLRFVPAIIPGYRVSQIIPTFARMLLSGAVMASCARLSSDTFGAGVVGLVAAVAVGAATYVAMLFVTGAVKRTDLRELVGLFRKKEASYAPAPAVDA